MPPRIRILDHHDSFTHNLASLLSELGASVEVSPFDGQPWRILPYDTAIVLSPGPGHPNEYPQSIDLVRSCERPLLGICLGLQLMVTAFGGNVIPAREPHHGRIDSVAHAGSALFHGIPSPFSVVRYHSLVAEMDAFPSDLEISARSTNAPEIMAIAHRSRPMQALQFHPESFRTDHGKTLISNWLRTLA